jgi:hypothetical protein
VTTSNIPHSATRMMTLASTTQPIARRILTADLRPRRPRNSWMATSVLPEGSVLRRLGDSSTIYTLPPSAASSAASKPTRS